MSPDAARWANGAGFAGLVVLVVAVFLAPMVGPSGDLVFLSLTVALTALAVPGGGLSAAAIRGSWPYLAYLAAITGSVLLVRTLPAWHEYARLVALLCLAFAAARLSASARRLRVLLAAVITCMAIVLAQAALDALLLTETNRTATYPSLVQWSGYPELGTLAAMATCACLAIGATSRRTLLSLASGVLAACFALTSLLLNARAAWLAIAVTALWVAAVAAWRWRRITALLVLLVVGAAGWATARSFPVVGRYVTTIGVLAEKLASESRTGGWSGLEQMPGALEVTTRIGEWRAAVAMVRDRPFFGVGPGMYTSAYPRYSNLHYGVHAHNLMLQVAAEEGLLGLAAFLLIWWRVLKTSHVGAVWPGIRMVAFALNATLLAFLARSQGDDLLAAALPTSSRFLVLLGVMFGLCEAVGRVYRTQTGGIPGASHDEQAVAGVPNAQGKG